MSSGDQIPFYSNCVICNYKLDQPIPRRIDLNVPIQYNCKICGNVSGSMEWLEDIGNDPNRIFLSGFTRDRTERKEPPFVLKNDNYEELIKDIKNYSIQKKLDSLLEHLKQKSEFPGDIIKLAPKTDYPLSYSIKPEEFNYYLGHLIIKGYLKGNLSVFSDGFSITVRGWERLDSLEKGKIDSDRVFVAMNFDKEPDKIYENGIKPAIEECGYKSIKVDEIEHIDKIDDKIISEIRKCKFLIADCTGHKNGVYFEAGFALGMEKPVIWCCKKDELGKSHFDTRQYNHIDWQDVQDLKKRLINRIEAIIGANKAK